MKSPNKFYLLRNKIGVILGSWFSDSCNQLENIEYIRKEVLLEWAQNMKRVCKGAEPIEKAYQTMIDKIESL